jgi:hypothetical protein
MSEAKDQDIITDKLIKKFWPKVEKSGPIPECNPSLGQCWTWKGAINKTGYGHLSIGRPNKGSVRAHRLAYLLCVGPIPEGLILDHLCRNRACPNPAHVEPVTHRENLLRGNGFVGINHRKTHCPKGHPYSGHNLINRFYKGKHMRICRICINQKTANWQARQRAGLL